jgi:hypothetical protein
MKLRLQGNSLRLRLKRPEVERLCATGAVEEFVEFGCGATLTYRLYTVMQPGPAKTEFQDRTIAVSIGTDEARAWANSDDVGIYAQSGALAVSIEKDFRCLTRPLDDDERDTFPNPEQRPDEE